MRVIFGFFWSFVLVQMASYVISSMTGGTYDFKLATIISLVVGVLVMLISVFIPNEPVEQH
ncbi:YjzD family protein [Microbacteriaceae bacterium 4G12]